MNPVQIHLMVVHLPIVGLLFTLGLLTVAAILRQELLWKVGLGFLFVCLVTTFAAYYSGPPAYAYLAETHATQEATVEAHAVIGRAAFFAVLVLGAVALQGIIAYVRGQKLSVWLKMVLWSGTLLVCYLLIWTGHLGGAIRHPEIREPRLPLFPSFGETNVTTGPVASFTGRYPLSF